MDKENTSLLKQMEKNLLWLPWSQHVTWRARSWVNKQYMLFSSRGWIDCKLHCHSLQHKSSVWQPEN